jgi:hypothetical protein
VPRLAGYGRIDGASMMAIVAALHGAPDAK